MWDEKRATACGELWGIIFAEEVELIQNDLLKGDTAALSKWMESERELFLSDEPIFF